MNVVYIHFLNILRVGINTLRPSKYSCIFNLLTFSEIKAMQTYKNVDGVICATCIMGEIYTAALIRKSIVIKTKQRCLQNRNNVVFQNINAIFETGNV